jgi:hypothetical protein
MLLAAIGSTGALGLAACLGSVNRQYSEGGTEAGPTTGDDATVDSPPAEGAPGMDGAVARDGDAMVIEEMAPPETSPPTDAPVEVGPPGQTYDCNGQMVTSCANCTGKPVDCVYCTNGGAHPGVCGPQGMLCNTSAPGGASVCTCNGGVQGNVASCPAPFQACTYIGTIGGMFYCQTCGEMGSNMEACKGGGHCNATTGVCN